MPKKNKYRFGQNEFSSQDAVRKYASALRQKYQPGESITSDDDVAFLRDLISGHVERETKVGRGVARFFWGYAPEHQSECFWIEREDGSMTDFGVPACLKGIGGINRQSLRMAIAPQLEEYKRRALVGKTATFVSEYSGKEFPISEAVVDHVDEFESIVKRFFESKDIDLSAELLTRSVDQRSLPEWRDPTLLAEFLVYHGRFPLRVVHRRENLSEIKIENRMRRSATAL